MQIYVVLGYDRHTDVICEVYTDKEQAKQRFLDYCGWKAEEGMSECETYCYYSGDLYAEFREQELIGGKDVI